MKRYRVELESRNGKFKGLHYFDTLKEAEQFGDNWTYLELALTNEGSKSIRLFTVWEENKLESLKAGYLYNPNLQ